MGYYVSITIDNIIIPADKVQECLDAINALFQPETMKKYAGGGSFSNNVRAYHYSWVNTPESGAFDDLIAAFDEWRYEAQLLDDGSVEVVYFTGEKLGDDEILYKTIAPFITDGTISLLGEDHDHWRFLFNNGTCKEQAGHITYS